MRDRVGSPRHAGTSSSSGLPRGFAEAAMRCGANSFVGTFGTVSDEGGADLSVAFYANLLTGATTAEALRAARQQTAHTTLDSGLLYTAFGYPEFRLTSGKQRSRTRSAIARWIADVKKRSGWPRGPLLRLVRRCKLPGYQ